MGEGDDVTLAVEEQKTNLGGWERGEERAKVMRLRRPRMWFWTKERRVAWKLTAQAAWMIDTAFAANEV